MLQKKETICRRDLMLIWILGLAGQLCWNVENQWFNTFVYAKIGPYPWIISWMTAVSAAVTTFSTFWFGTLSDRKGKRKPFVCIGYIMWGVFTIVFGLAEFLPKNQVVAAAVTVVAADALMSFFGSMGNDSGFNSWTTDITNENNRGQLGAILAALPVIATILGTVVSGLLIETLGYFVFFIVMGVLVILVGLLGLLRMQEGPGLKPARDEKGFWHQFFSVFNFRTLKENKELFWVFLIMTAYFTGFNAFFAHAGNYFIYTLGFDEGMAGILQGAGLGVAVLATIPTIGLINRGRHALLIAVSMAASVAGLAVLAVCGADIVLLLVGILLVGVGYVLVMQTTTAWVKNLYPETSRGQFEGVRIVFNVLVPMVLGPGMANIVISNCGIPVVIDGTSGMAPSCALFVAAAAVMVLVLLPTWMAVRVKNRS